MQSTRIRIALVLALASPAAAQTVQSSWTATKNASADNVYQDNGGNEPGVNRFSEDWIQGAFRGA